MLNHPRFEVQALNYRDGRLDCATFVNEFGHYRDAMHACRMAKPTRSRHYRVFDRLTNRILFVASDTGRDHVPQHNAPRGVFLANVAREFGWMTPALWRQLRDGLGGHNRAPLPG